MITLAFQRNFPIEKDCADYHKRCSSDADCHNCPNRTLECRESKKAKKNGIKLLYCRPKHEDDPHKKREHPSSQGFKSHFQRVLVDNIDVDTLRNNLWQLLIADFMRRKLDGLMQSTRDDVLRSQQDVMKLIKGDVMQSKGDDVIHSNKNDNIKSKQNNDITGAAATKPRPNAMLAKLGNIFPTALDRMIADFRKELLGFLEHEYYILHHEGLVLRILVEMMLRSNFGTEDTNDRRKMLDTFHFRRKSRYPF